MEQLFNFLKSDFFALIVVPILVTLVTAGVKICSKDIRSRLFEIADLAAGFDLYIAGIVALLTFVIIEGNHYSPVTPNLTDEQIEATNQNNNELVLTALTGALCSGLLIVALAPILALYSRFGWVGLYRSGEVIYQQTDEAVLVMLFIGSLVFGGVGAFIGAH